MQNRFCSHHGNCPGGAERAPQQPLLFGSILFIKTSIPWKIHDAGSCTMNHPLPEMRNSTHVGKEQNRWLCEALTPAACDLYNSVSSASSNFFINTGNSSILIKPSPSLSASLISFEAKSFCFSSSA